MTRYLTAHCECPDVITGTGGKRPTEPCKEHGERFQTEAELRSAGVGAVPVPGQATVRGGVDSSTPRRKPRKRSSEPKRDWSLALAKKEEEGNVCRVCGAHGTECAHILGRKYDQPISPGSKTLLVLPDRIVPLCGGAFADGCHYHYDRHELDLLPYLTTAEQAQAILDAGSIVTALHRISPSLEFAA